MALENEHKHPGFEVLCKIILTLNIPADNFFIQKAKIQRTKKNS